MVNQLVVLFGLLVLSGILSGIETAFVSLSDVKVRALLEKKRKGSRALARLKAKPQRPLITILIGNNLVNIGASAYATFLITNLVGSKGVGIATGIMTFLILFFGEVIPKSFAVRRAEMISLAAARPLEMLQIALSPLVWFFYMSSRGVLRTIGGGKRQPIVTESELRAMAKLGVEEGTIPKKEREMLESIFKFNEITAEDVMTPRVEMFTLNQDLRLADALRVIIRSSHSRIPLHKKNRDDITGILHVRNVLVHLAHRRSRAVKLKELAQKPFFVPKEKTLDELFKEFQKQRSQMAIVLDEHGGTEGLVTTEDLIGELVGEMIEEGDISSEVIMRLEKNTILVDGGTELKLVNRFLNVHVPGGDLETVSEVILRQLGKIPGKGDIIEFNNLEMEVIDVTKKKINRVKIKKTQP